ncbi:ComEA family DNA-binding protein [Corynebacterium halotolerans]|uniref:ComEA family DNA-binding protein n=1 Tax=Corynebacterium halotolerans TaxID=225326 RepID=UPI003CF2C013
MSGISDRIREFTRPTGEETVMTVNYPRPRLRVGVKEAAVAAVIVLVAVAAWLVLRGGATPETVTGDPAAGPPAEVLAAVTGDPSEQLPVSGSAAAPTAAPGTQGHAQSSGVPEEVVVSVVGAVTHPGLVTLEPEARVADALSIAVPRPEAVLTPLNLAQKLSDGEQILVPVEGEEPPAPAPGGEPSPAPGDAGDTAGPVSLNTADATQLTMLNGVGEKTAAAIISHREEIGSFTDIGQLQDVKGIGPAKFDDLKDQVTL